MPHSDVADFCLAVPQELRVAGDLVGDSMCVVESLSILQTKYETPPVRKLGQVGRKTWAIAGRQIV